MCQGKKAIFARKECVPDVISGVGMATVSKAMQTVHSVPDVISGVGMATVSKTIQTVCLEKSYICHKRS